VPLVWVLSVSFRSGSDVFRSIFVPHSFAPGNYTEAWHKYGLGVLFINSTLITAGTVILSLALSVTAAYGFSRHRTRLRESLFLLILTGLMIPPAAIIIPFFVLMNDLQLYDKLFAVVLAETAFVLPPRDPHPARLHRQHPRRAERCRARRWSRRVGRVPPRRGSAVASADRDGGAADHTLDLEWLPLAARAASAIRRSRRSRSASHSSRVSSACSSGSSSPRPP